ncbi:MAG TPA: ATPase, T2SS/T4P/T4SS family [Planctomycetaceae bacterium]|jgi:pilus assembly protein CpaF|nr:ATPase, T2SS/T4P/T4SS family [Planctomycetaceae bacterium]
MMGLAPRTRSDDQKSFQKLKAVLEGRIVEAVDLSRAPDIDSRELRDQVKALATQVCASDSVGLPAEMRETMVGEILAEIYGFGPLEALMNDPQISDVLVNGPDNVCVERNGVLEETPVRFADEAHLRQLIERLVRRAGRRISERSPVVEAQLPDGSLLNVVLTPPAVRGPLLSLRPGGPKRVGLEDLLRRGSLAPEMVDFLTAAVRGRLNLLISGATGAGKTTLLGGLARLIPESERIVTIEQTAELNLDRPGLVSLEARSTGGPGQLPVTLREILRSGLRMRPDRLVVGEVRGGETLDLLQAMSAGHPGSMLTVNAISTRDALERIELLTAAGDGRPSSGLYQQIASAFQLLIHVARLPSGERKVVRISELCGYFDGSYVIEDIFVYRAAGTDEQGRAQGQFYSTGYEPQCLLQLTSQEHALEGEFFAPKELSPAVLDRALIQT